MSGDCLIYDFQQALGQYPLYHRLIELTEREYRVYLPFFTTAHE
ncbi:element excision factor XisH family protein [Thermocoleostomius sinensis]|nr:element excision factor XisH family protein [Thermocoleostomius sinensis]